jgi:hypothetical protein
LEANLGGDDSAKPPPAAAVCVVVDTDTYNEIDDQLGVVYALLSSERIRTGPRSTRVVTVSQWVSEAAIAKPIVRAKQCIRVRARFELPAAEQRRARGSTCAVDLASFV